jgi:hypothetical protein
MREKFILSSKIEVALVGATLVVALGRVEPCPYTASQERSYDGASNDKYNCHCESIQFANWRRGNLSRPVSFHLVILDPVGDPSFL